MVDQTSPGAPMPDVLSQVLQIRRSWRCTSFGSFLSLESREDCEVHRTRREKCAEGVHTDSSSWSWVGSGLGGDLN
jgi:hypothetical protein